MARPWFRMYRGILSSPKIQRLSGDTFKFWVNCLAMTDDDGSLPSLPDIAYVQRVSETVAEIHLQALTEARLIDAKGNRFKMHDWNEHQRSSDVSTERVKRFRKRSETVSETPLEKRREDTEQKREEERERARPRATRWPSGQKIPPDWIAEAEKIRRDGGFPAINLQAEAENFVDYWTSKSGANATKTDWRATWRKWIRSTNAAPISPPANGARMGPA